MKIWEIEKENFAWIDFFWSTLGRSGNMGSDVELIYEKLYEKKPLKIFLAKLQSILRKNMIFRIFMVYPLLLVRTRLSQNC